MKMLIACLAILSLQNTFSYQNEDYTVVSETRSGDQATKVIAYKKLDNAFQCSLTVDANSKNRSLLNDMNIQTICYTAYLEKKYSSLELTVTERTMYNVNFDCTVQFTSSEEVQAGRCGLEWYPGFEGFSYGF